MYPLLFSVTTTQVDVPSTCTTKDVPSNVVIRRREKARELKEEAHGSEMDEYKAYFRGKKNVPL